MPHHVEGIYQYIRYKGTHTGKRQVGRSRLQACEKPVTKVSPQPSSYYESLVRENEMLLHGILQLIKVIYS